jgi:hypothetical protein
MYKLPMVVVLLATAPTICRGSFAAELPFGPDFSGSGNTVVLVGGMGGGTGGGMGGGAGGMGGGGMGGMTGGGMGGMTGGGMGGVFGGTSGYGGMPGNSPGRNFGGPDPSGGGAEPAQYYLCVTPYDRCSLASSPCSLRSGSLCTCSTGHRGTIK